MNRGTSPVEIRIVRDWETAAIIELYRAAGWWRDGWDRAGITPMIQGSTVFVVAVEEATGRTVGMGRLISDGVSDGYIQDLVVHPDFRRGGLGRRLVKALVLWAQETGLLWLGVIAEPGAEGFYQNLGFRVMEGYTPLLLTGLRDADNGT